MYFSALTWISSMGFTGRLESESLNTPSLSPFSNVSTTAWVSNSSTNNVSALNLSRKSRSSSPCHWDNPRRLLTGLGLNLRVVKWTRKRDCKFENLQMDLYGRELNHFKVAFFNAIGNAQHLTGSKAPTNAILDLKASICFCGSNSHHKAPC